MLNENQKVVLKPDTDTEGFEKHEIPSFDRAYTVRFIDEIMIGLEKRQIITLVEMGDIEYAGEAFMSVH